MAESVVNFVVEKLCSLLTQNINSLRDVSSEVEGLLEELRQMKCFLKDADAKKNQNETIRDLVAKIREEAYNVEDLIETFAVNSVLGRRKRTSNIILNPFSCFRKIKSRWEVAQEIENFRSRMARYNKSLQDYGVFVINERDAPSSSLQWRGPLRRTYSHVIEEHFVGFEEDVKTLVAEVVRQEKGSSLVSICGMGGIGKTSVAKKIYHHQDVRSHFDAFAWASISQQWQLKDVLIRILTSLTNSKSDRFGGMIVEELVKSLYHFQQEKRCLIVLDDVWQIDAWKELSPAFPTVNSGSKILLTTRNKDVVTMVDRSYFLHELQFLSKEQSWELLQKKSFPGTNDTGTKFDPIMEDLGKEMVEHCGGLPLAIVVLGGILATKCTLGQWKEVHRNIKSYLKRGKGHGEENSQVMEVLALSYQELPYRLKACFLYLGMYPEDYEIEVEQLYQLWMAEGFIQEIDGNEEETMMDVAEYYLGQLAQRCIVQADLKSEDDRYMSTSGRYTVCRIHDLLRDLCLLKMKEENFAKVVDHRKSRHTESSASMLVSATGGSISNCYRTHRLAIYLDEDSNDFFHIVEREEGIHDIRSLLFFLSNETPPFEEKMKHFVEGFKMLRVFYFSSPQGTVVLPGEFEHLVLLRYLALGSNLERGPLPSSIGNLRFLQTLDLSRVETEVPYVLWKIEGLMHLYLPWDAKCRAKIGGLSNLQILADFNTSCSDAKELFNLTKLRRLIDVDIQKNEDLATVINYLNSSSSKLLQYTSISISDCDLSSERGSNLLRELFKCDRLGELRIYGTIGRLPEYDSDYLQGLTTLCLSDSKLEEDAMSILEKLPNLRDLSLVAAVFRSKHMVCSARGFPLLKILSFIQTDTEEWEVDGGALPNLSELFIYGCHKLRMLPNGLRFITNLKRLVIQDMPKAFNNRIRVGDGIEGEDVHKVAHIPNVLLLDLPDEDDEFRSLQ